MSSAFTPRRVAQIEEGIRLAAKEIVAEAAPTGGGDFVSLIAKRLPLQTISDMIGVPDADREQVVDAADTIVSVADERVPRRARSAGHAGPGDLDALAGRVGDGGPSREASRRTT